MSIWEIVIVAVVLTLLTMLFTGPGLWSSSWGFRKREDEILKKDKKEPPPKT